MNMTITELSPGTLNALQSLARRNGKTLEEYARSILERVTDEYQDSKPDNEEWLNDFRQWMDSLDPNTPNLTDEQISRESIYEEQILRHV